MSTATDNELPPPPTKPRLNPLDFRNTDLVSRLLAATPPYLYNMPMVPNSYFFSEMLRSFVQAKSDAISSTNTSSTTTRSNLGYQRRARKRPWSHQNHSSRVGLEYFDNSKATSWHPNHKRSSEVPLELTSPKIGDSGISIKAVCGGTEDSTPPDKSQNDQQTTNHIVNNFNIPTQSQDSSSLLLPPPPPLWYPPMYPPPYGIDPLHFFIDLRVSGHIYDRKNGKDSTNAIEQSAQLDVVGAPNNSEQNRDFFRQSRHASAFSVPISASVAKNVPMNLSNVKHEVDTKLKFNVKSMVYNKTGTSYVMRNINSIYKEMSSQKNHNIGENTNIDDNATDINVDDDTTEESGVKRAKHLKALFGLEMVVDYMKKKPASTVINVNSGSSGTTSDNDSVGSPALDVVDVNDDSSCM